MQKNTIIRVADEHADSAQMLSEALKGLGMPADMDIEIDGQVHVFEIDDKDSVQGTEDGYYIADTENGLSIAGDMMGHQTIIFPKGNMAPEELACAFEKANSAFSAAAEVLQKNSPMVLDFWNSLDAADRDDIFFTSRGLNCAYGTRKSDGAVVIAYKDLSGKYVYAVAYRPDGTWEVIKGNRSEGCFTKVGDAPAEFVTSDFASAATIYQTTGHSCIAVESPSDLPLVLERNPKLTIVIPDIPEFVEKAGECEKEYGCEVVKIPLMNNVAMTANAFMVSGGDVPKMLGLKPRARKFLTISEILGTNINSSWTIRGLIPQGASLSMVYGPSGKGKTYVLIDMALSIACGLSDWFGLRVRKGKVLYLLGEGLGAVRERIQCWIQQHDVSVEQFANSFAMTTVNFPIDSEEKLDEMCGQLESELAGFRPDVIVIDTLNLFMAGDENSTHDANAFIFALKKMARDYNCAAVMVHHTGVSTESRNRGSSVFFGALDSCISVTRDDNNPAVIDVRQTKNRGLAELPTIFLQMEVHDVEGTIDEDTGKPRTNAILVATTEPAKVHVKTKDYTFLSEDCRKAYNINAGVATITKAQLESCYQEKFKNKSKSDVKREFNLNQDRTLHRLLKYNLLEAVEGQPDVFEIIDEDLIKEIVGVEPEDDPEIDDDSDDFADYGETDDDGFSDSGYDMEVEDSSEDEEHPF